jgi:hypothetical protein
MTKDRVYGFRIRSGMGEKEHPGGYPLSQSPAGGSRQWARKVAEKENVLFWAYPQTLDGRVSEHLYHRIKII